MMLFVCQEMKVGPYGTPTDTELTRDARLYQKISCTSGGTPRKNQIHDVLVHPVVDELLKRISENCAQLFRAAEPAPPGVRARLAQTIFSSCRAPFAANRPASSGEISTTGVCPRYRSRRTSPTAGAIRKPC